MKNLVFILSVAISLSIISGCSDSDIDPGPEINEPGPEIPPDDIVGYWQMTKIIKDGVDLTDECTTRSFMNISKLHSFVGDDFDYDVVNDDCLLTKFVGGWVHKIDNQYTFDIYEKEFIIELYGDTIRAEFIHFFDGQHYMEEHVRRQ